MNVSIMQRQSGKKLAVEEQIDAGETLDGSDE